MNVCSADRDIPSLHYPALPCLQLYFISLAFHLHTQNLLFHLVAVQQWEQPTLANGGEQLIPDSMHCNIKVGGNYWAIAIIDSGSGFLAFTAFTEADSGYPSP
jgi:hypothetical protein